LDEVMLNTTIQVVQEIVEAFKKGKRVYFAGNWRQRWRMRSIWQAEFFGTILY